MISIKHPEKIDSDTLVSNYPRFYVIDRYKYLCVYYRVKLFGCDSEDSFTLVCMHTPCRETLVEAIKVRKNETFNTLFGAGCEVFRYNSLNVEVTP